MHRPARLPPGIPSHPPTNSDAAVGTHLFWSRDGEVTDCEEDVGVGFAEAEPVAEHPVGEAAQNDVHGVLHHDVHLILQRNTARLEQSEP